MRMYNHYAFRKWASKQKADSAEILILKHLRPTIGGKPILEIQNALNGANIFLGDNLRIPLLTIPVLELAPLCSGMLYSCLDS